MCFAKRQCCRRFSEEVTELLIKGKWDVPGMVTASPGATAGGDPLWSGAMASGGTVPLPAWSKASGLRVRSAGQGALDSLLGFPEVA